MNSVNDQVDSLHVTRVLRVLGATQETVARTSALETALSLAGGRGRGVTA